MPSGIIKWQSTTNQAIYFEDSANLYESDPKAFEKEWLKIKAAVRRREAKQDAASAAAQGASIPTSSSQAVGAQQTASPATCLKRPRGPTPFGKRWDEKQGWVANAEAAKEDAQKKAAREATGQRGPGRPPLAPREGNAEAKGVAADLKIKETQRAVLSTFMEEHEATATEIPEQNARAALRMEEPDDVSAQQVCDPRRAPPSAAAACLQAHTPSFALQIKLHERFLDTAIAPLCKVCHRRRPQIGFHLLSRSSSEDTARCSVCHQHGEAFTFANNNDTSPPPPSASRPLYCGPIQCLEWYKELCLKASLTEELLVTKFRTFLIMRRMPHQHLRYRGHTIAFVQVDRLLHSHSHAASRLDASDLLTG